MRDHGFLRGATLRTISLITALLIAGLPARTAAGEKGEDLRLDLKQCLERASEIDPEIIAREAEVRIAEARHMEAVSQKYLPKFEITNALTLAPGVHIADNDLIDPETRNNWRRVGLFNRLELRFVQPIFSFGRIKGGIEAARQGIAARKESLRKQRNQIALMITQLYYSRLLARELITLAEEAESTAKKAEDTLTRMLDEDQNPDLDEADLFRIRLFKVELEEAGREIATGNELTLSALKTSLNLSPDTRFDIQDEFLEARTFEILSLGHYCSMERSHRPEIAQIEAAWAAQNALVRVSRASYYPQLFVGGGTTLSFAPLRDDINNPFLKDPFNYKSVGAYLGISMPLNFNRTKARVFKAEYELDKIEAQRTAARNAIYLEVKKAYLDLLESQRKMQANQKALILSQEWKTMEQISFDLDGVGGRDLVDAVRAYFESKAALFQSVYEFNISIAQLEYVTGTIARL